MLQRLVGFAGWIAHFQSHAGICDAAFDQDGYSCRGAADNHAVHVDYISGTFPPVLLSLPPGTAMELRLGWVIDASIAFSSLPVASKSNRRIGLAANCACSGCEL